MSEHMGLEVLVSMRARLRGPKWLSCAPAREEQGLQQWGSSRETRSQAGSGSKCGPQTTSIDTTCELVRNAKSQIPTRPTDSETLKVGSAICVFTSPLGDFEER